MKQKEILDFISIWTTSVGPTLLPSLTFFPQRVRP